MQLSNKSVKSQYVLGIEDGEEYRAIQLPDDKVEQVDKILASGRSIQVSGKFLERDKIIGIFPTAEWKNLAEMLKTPPKDNYEVFKRDMEVFKTTGKHPRRNSV